MNPQDDRRIDPGHPATKVRVPRRVVLPRWLVRFSLVRETRVREVSP